MEFCPKCGSVLIKKKKRYVCPKCGYVSPKKVEISYSEKMGKKTKLDVLHEKDSNIWPVVTAVCPKCGYNKAYYFSAQTRAGDEAETQFFKCVKCGFTWRKYS